MQTRTSSWRFRQRESLPCSVFNPRPPCFAAPFALLPCPCLLTPVCELPFQEPRNHSAPDSNPSGQPIQPGWQLLAFQHWRLVMPHLPVLTPGVSWQLEEAAASRPAALYPTPLSLHHLPHTTAHSFFFCPVDHKSLGKLFGEANHFYSSSLPSLWISGSLTL